jgi:hypothetical protein
MRVQTGEEMKELKETKERLGKERKGRENFLPQGKILLAEKEATSWIGLTIITVSVFPRCF